MERERERERAMNIVGMQIESDRRGVANEQSAVLIFGFFKADLSSKVIFFLPFIK